MLYNFYVIMRGNMNIFIAYTRHRFFLQRW